MEHRCESCGTRIAGPEPESLDLCGACLAQLGFRRWILEYLEAAAGPDGVKAGSSGPAEPRGPDREEPRTRRRRTRRGRRGKATDHAGD